MRPYGYLRRQYSVKQVIRSNGGYDDRATDPPEKGAERNNNKRIILRDVVLTLDAFDDALRAESIQNVAASSEDVRRTADELVVKLKDVRDAIDEATSAPSVRGQ